MGIEQEIFQRNELLLGQTFTQKIAEITVIIFGVGGVGSWCAESLVRSGVKHITIVDSDRVSASNINRQLLATTKTVGMVKTEVLKSRLLEIYPDANITALQKIYDEETSASFGLDNFDYIIDAIDSLKNKVHLLQTASRTNAKTFASMGAALKLDPTRMRVTEFWKVQGCPLAAALRSRIKKQGGLSKKITCVFSDELLENKGQAIDCRSESEPQESTQDVQGNDALAQHDWNKTKARINGTSSYMPAIFGMTLASLVVQDLYAKSNY